MHEIKFFYEKVENLPAAEQTIQLVVQRDRDELEKFKTNSSHTLALSSQALWIKTLVAYLQEKLFHDGTTSSTSPLEATIKFEFLNKQRSCVVKLIVHTIGDKRTCSITIFGHSSEASKTIVNLCKSLLCDDAFFAQHWGKGLLAGLGLVGLWYRDNLLNPHFYKDNFDYYSRRFNHYRKKRRTELNRNLFLSQTKETLSKRDPSFKTFQDVKGFLITRSEKDPTIAIMIVSDEAAKDITHDWNYDIHNVLLEPLLNELALALRGVQILAFITENDHALPKKCQALGKKLQDLNTGSLYKMRAYDRFEPRQISSLVCPFHHMQTSNIFDRIYTVERLFNEPSIEADFTKFLKFHTLKKVKEALFSTLNSNVSVEVYPRITFVEDWKDVALLPEEDGSHAPTSLFVPRTKTCDAQMNVYVIFKPDDIKKVQELLRIRSRTRTVSIYQRNDYQLHDHAIALYGDDKNFFMVTPETILEVNSYKKLLIALNEKITQIVDMNLKPLDDLSKFSRGPSPISSDDESHSEDSDGDESVKDDGDESDSGASSVSPPKLFRGRQEPKPTTCFITLSTLHAALSAKGISVTCPETNTSVMKKIHAMHNFKITAQKTDILLAGDYMMSGACKAHVEKSQDACKGMCVFGGKMVAPHMKKSVPKSDAELYSITDEAFPGLFAAFPTLIIFDDTGSCVYVKHAQMPEFMKVEKPTKQDFHDFLFEAITNLQKD